MENIAREEHHPHEYVEFKPSVKDISNNIANYFKLATIGSSVLVMDIVGSNGELKARRKLNVELG